jgi:hypothetical protein
MQTAFDNILGQGVITPAERPPVDVLSELAKSLDKQVAYAMIFSVESSSVADRVQHSLRLYVQKLDYTLELVSLSHKVVQLYPVRISGYLVQSSTDIETDVANEPQLVQALVKMFQSDLAKEVIGTLLVQAK